MPTDRLRTQEQLVVEDLPEYLNRIQQYIYQVDHAPTPVADQAHVLQITLKDIPGMVSIFKTSCD